MLVVLECVVNVAFGRRRDLIESLAEACGAPLADVHVDQDHDRTVFTLVDTSDEAVGRAARRLAGAIVGRPELDLAANAGVHPRLGILDVVPFVSLDGRPDRAGRQACRFARWWAEAHAVPTFLYDDADPEARSLPSVRRDAFCGRVPDFGTAQPHPRLGSTAVGARPVMIAVNCELATADVEVARAIAETVRARDGGLPGVRALGLRLRSRGTVQVSMNLVELSGTGLEEACGAVRHHAREAGTSIDRVELVGLVPARELARCTQAFRTETGLGVAHTIEAALVRRPRPELTGDTPPGDAG